MSFLKFRHIDFALTKVAPNTIPLSEPKALNNDFFSIYIFIEKLNIKLLCKTKEKGGYSGFLWDKDELGMDATILFETFNQYPFRVEIKHYYRGYEFQLENKFLFILYFLSEYNRFVVYKNKFLQGIYNKKTLVRSERMELLNYLVEKTIENPTFETSPISLGAQRHSNRWYHHPQRVEHQTHYKLILNSLVETGDLTFNNSSYSVTGKALATLSDYELEQQKHQDIHNNSKVTHRLTLALILISGFGLIANIAMWWLDK